MPDIDTMDVQLTKEMEDAIRAYLPIKVEDTWPYVPAAYRKRRNDGEYLIPKSYWPVFTIRGVDGVQATIKEDELFGTYKFDGDQPVFSLKSGRMKIDTAKRGIKTWSNYRDETGKVIPAPETDSVTGGISEASLRILPPQLISELCNAITERSKLTHEELLGLKS